MGANSKIEWCTHTLNFWVGCTALSPACEGCYAEAWAKRAGTPELWTGERRRTTPANWRQALRWNASAPAHQPAPRVFANSLSDFFDNQVPRAWREDAWTLISQCEDLDWMLLTKRPENIGKMLPPPPFAWGKGWNSVWLGTTVEDRARKHRIDTLRRVPARVRFLSIEPLLEDLGALDLRGIHLVIVGGETGPKARPMDPVWVRPIRDQCAAAGVAFFFKQWGDWHADALRYTECRTGLCPPPAMKIGKRKAGRTLDGVEHDGMPAP